MIATVGQGGAGCGHRLDRDEIRILRVIDLDARPWGSEGQPEHVVVILDFEFRRPLAWQQIKIVEGPTSEFAIKIIETGEREGTITISHGKTSIIEKDMFQIRKSQATARWSTVHREIWMPAEGDRHVHTCVGDHGCGDA